MRNAGEEWIDGLRADVVLNVGLRTGEVSNVELRADAEVIAKWTANEVSTRRAGELMAAD